MPPMRLVVTRPEEDAEALAQRLEALGHEPLIAPLLKIVPRAPELPRASWRAVVITSANGARSLPAGHGLGDTPAFTVGAQSRAAALGAGFKSVTAAGGDAAGLASFLVNTLTPAAGPLLYLSGAETAGDAEGRLRTAGFAVTRVVLYDAVAAAALPPFGPRAIDGVLLYSPRTARIWAALAGGTAHAKARCFCLSANVAEALGPAYMTAIAAAPDDAAMLALIGKGT